MNAQNVPQDFKKIYRHVWMSVLIRNTLILKVTIVYRVSLDALNVQDRLNLNVLNVMPIDF